MEKGEMYFRIIEEGMLEKITMQNIHWVMAPLKQNKAFYSKGPEVQKSANVLHFNVWIVSDYLFHCFFPKPTHFQGNST